MDWSIEDIKRTINCLDKLLANCDDEWTPDHNIMDNDFFWYTIVKNAFEKVLSELTEEAELNNNSKKGEK